MSRVPETLGVALRTWRERLVPADVGMVTTADRRTSGLRREELAALANISVDYVTRLEQGRARPSPAVLSALTRSLLLSADERDHLFGLAGHAAPSPALISDYVPVGVQRLLVRLGDVPIAVFSADWTLISFSPLWGALMGVSPARIREAPNLVRIAFLGGDGPHGLGDHPISTIGDAVQDRADLVADLHATAGRYPHDPRLSALIDELLANEGFAAAWRLGSVARHRSVRKLVSHPLGDVVLDCDTLTVPGADLHILVYTASEGSRDAEFLRFLRVSRDATLIDRVSGRPGRE